MKQNDCLLDHDIDFDHEELDLFLSLAVLLNGSFLTACRTMFFTRHCANSALDKIHGAANPGADARWCEKGASSSVARDAYLDTKSVNNRPAAVAVTRLSILVLQS